jgi:hypothetical protein
MEKPILHLLSTHSGCSMTSPMMCTTGGLQMAAFPILSNRSFGAFDLECMKQLQCKRQPSAPLGLRRSHRSVNFMQETHHVRV